MVPSAFNVRVPLRSGDVFVMNTLTDAQVVVSPDVADMLARASVAAEEEDHRESADEARALLAEHGFLVPAPAADREAVEARFAAFRTDATEVRVTVLTTLQCNFACDYCYQGEHGAGVIAPQRMSLETAGRVADWVSRELARVRPQRLVLTFFGGEPLLNAPAMFDIAERCSEAARAAGIEQVITLITNGLLLTPAVVERLLPLGLCGVKVTLDGDRETHNRMRPLRGGQGTFDRIVENMRRVAPLVPLTVGGNFDTSTAEAYPALLEFLRNQDFADRIAEVTFKPVIRPAAATRPGGVIPLTDVGRARPRSSGCGSGGASSGSVCDSCHFADDHLAFLRGETRRYGFSTNDGVHMGPCDLYREHSHTIGPDGALFACPGFTGENAQSVGHIDRAPDPGQLSVASRVEQLAPWRQCGDCAFVPVCGGGCAVAAHAELGDMLAPSCHKRAFESALIALAEDAAGAELGG